MPKRCQSRPSTNQRGAVETRGDQIHWRRGGVSSYRSAMICGKCGQANPAEGATCSTCGASLASQRFAAALADAQPDKRTDSPPAADPLPSAAVADHDGDSPGANAVAPAAQPEPSFAPLGRNLAAQEHVNEYVAEQRSRRRVRLLIWISGLLSAIAVVSVLGLRSARIKARREGVVRFYMAFLQVDDTVVSKFWRCVADAQHLDVRLARDNLVLTQGLQRSFSAAPERHVQRIRKQCLPLLDDAATRWSELAAPAGFGERLAKVIESLNTVASKFERYLEAADSLAQALQGGKQLQQDNAAFHGRGSAKARARYTAFVACAVPRLSAQLRAVKNPPNSQPIVESLYRQCKESQAFVEKKLPLCLRKAAGQGRARAALVRLLRQRIAGDDRDGRALEYCLNRAGKHGLRDGLDEAAKGWLAYRSARKEVVDEARKYKPQE